MPEIPSLLEMLKAGVHFGHRTTKWHPKMKPYIFTARNGVHIIDLEKTSAQIKKALEFIRDLVKEGGVIIFVGTKRQAQPIVKKYALECGMPYVSNRWLGGTITNFAVILKVIKKFKDMKRKQEGGEYGKYTKKEQQEFKQEIARLEELVGGVESLEKPPEALFVFDVKKDETAIREAKRKGISLVAVCDTNSSPEGINYVIPANDDASKSIEMIAGLVAAAVKEGRELGEAKKQLAEVKKLQEQKNTRTKEQKDVKI